jgi:hypothetical protein
LGAGHTVHPGALIRIDAQQAGDVIKQEQQVTVKLAQRAFPVRGMNVSGVII